MTPGSRKKDLIPSGTILPAGGSWVVNEGAFGPAPDRPEGFRLDSLGEGAWLFAANAAGQLLGPAHGFEFGASPNGVSFGANSRMRQWRRSVHSAGHA